MIDQIRKDQLRRLYVLVACFIIVGIVLPVFFLAVSEQTAVEWGGMLVCLIVSAGFLSMTVSSIRELRKQDP